MFWGVLGVLFWGFWGVLALGLWGLGCGVCCFLLFWAAHTNLRAGVGCEGVGLFKHRGVELMHWRGSFFSGFEFRSVSLKKNFTVMAWGSEVFENKNTNLKDRFDFCTFSKANTSGQSNSEIGMLTNIMLQGFNFDTLSTQTSQNS